MLHHDWGDYAVWGNSLVAHVTYCRPRRDGGLARQHFKRVPLHIRIKSWMDRSGTSDALDMFTALLSVFVVATYIADTYGYDLTIVDFIAGCFIALEWIFRIWLSSIRCADDDRDLQSLQAHGAASRGCKASMHEHLRYTWAWHHTTPQQRTQYMCMLLLQ